MLVLLLLCAGALTGANAPVPTTAQQRSAAKVIPSDAALARAVEARLAKSKISADKFQVQVQGGIVTLTGQTLVVQHKGVATRLAKLAGAKAVVNHIDISEEARSRAASNLAQGRRRLQLKRSEVTQR